MRGMMQETCIADRATASSRSRRLAAGPLAAILVPVLLAGCAESLPSLPRLADLNPFATKEPPLPGKRIPVLAESQVGAVSELAAADRPMSLPPFVGNESWTQPGGNAQNAPGHIALNPTVRVAWTSNAGTGSTKYGKITASPVAFGGRVFTLDAAAKVTAFNISGGGVAWSTSLVPEGERNPANGYGGGLAIDNGRLHAATGFGTVSALDLSNGRKLWEVNIGSPVRASPTAAQDRVAMVTLEGELVVLSGRDGSELWRHRSIDSGASLINNSSPAIDGDVVVAPFSSGDVIALSLSNGQVLWSESLSRARLASSLQSMSDAARPVIEGGVVYAVGHAGRMVATAARNGERLWSNTIGSLQQPVVAGDTIFAVDTQGQLHAVARQDGRTRWVVKLAGEGTWSGPVLAGNRLWAVSSKGRLVSVDALSGTVAGSQELGQAVFIGPIVAAGRMFVLTDAARLIALN